MLMGRPFLDGQGLTLAVQDGEFLIQRFFFLCQFSLYPL